MSRLRIVQPWHRLHLRRCREHLEVALTEAKNANCPALRKKISSAIKSAGGAERHMIRCVAHNPPNE